MEGLRAAIGFLTILPARPRPASDALARAPGWFPVAGLLIGLILAAVAGVLRLAYLLVSTGGSVPLAEVMGMVLDHPAGPTWLHGSILVGVLAVLTRGLHLDGFIDTCDALLGGSDRRRRLQILRDPHVGAFGVVGAVCLIMLKAAGLGELSASGFWWMILIVPAIPLGDPGGDGPVSLPQEFGDSALPSCRPPRYA